MTLMAQTIQSGWALTTRGMWHRVDDGKVRCSGAPLLYAIVHEIGYTPPLKDSCRQCVIEMAKGKPVPPIKDFLESL